jgi:hypothetical protein
MKRISLISLAGLALLLAPLIAAATPNPNSAVVKTRIFNDCPFTTLTVVNNYPSLISFEDAHLACSGFANMNNWTLSTDGVTGAQFGNDSDFDISTDLTITGHGEGGLRLSPWFSQDVDGLFNVRSTDGEIACFGGRLPFYTFTGVYGLRYHAGDPIHLEMTYKPHGLNASSPATIEYRVTYLGTSYSSGALNFDQGNTSEDPPHGLWGLLNFGEVGGHMKAFLDTPGNFNATTKATFTNIRYHVCPIELDPTTTDLNLRVFNDCPFTTLTTVNNYPSQISINDAGLACSGFANMHVWTLVDDHGAESVFNNDDDFSLSCDFQMTGHGEGGLRLSPWFSHYVDGLFNVRSTDGEIACFGGRLPFYTFTGVYGLRYTAGDMIHLSMTYKHNGLSAASPGTIQYDVVYHGTSYSSGPLNFDQGNTGEDPPHGLWGDLNSARVGGHMKAFLDTPGDFSAQTTANFTNIVYTAGHADAVVDINPDAFNLKSKGQVVTAYVQPVAPFTVADLDLSSFRLNGQAAGGNATVGDANHDGIQDVTVKFNRADAFVAIGDGTGVITGCAGDFGLIGSDNVTVLSAHGPAAGATVAPGSTAHITWQTPGGYGGASAAVLFSGDDGANWTLLVDNLANGGSYDATVPSGNTDKGRFGVQLTLNGSPAIAGITDAFVVSSPVGVDPVGVDMAFAMHGVTPNPSKGDINVSFSLPNAQRATIGMYDVSGRRVAFREVSLGAGRHTVTLANRLPAGMYMIKLSQGDRSVTGRAIVVK